MPICSSALGRALSITTSAATMRRRRSRRPCRGGQVQRHRALRAVEQVEESDRPTTGAVGARRRLHLDHSCPGVGQQLATEGTGPQRGEVDDRDLAERRCDPVAIADPPGRARAGRTRSVPGARRSPPRRIGSPSSAACSSSAATGRGRCRLVDDRPGIVSGDVAAQPGGQGRDVLGPGQGDRQPPVAPGHQTGRRPHRRRRPPARGRPERPARRAVPARRAAHSPRRGDGGPRPPGRPGRSTRAAHRGAGRRVVR